MTDAADAVSVRELIELGRDREAAKLADDRKQTRGEKMDVLRQLDELGPLLSGVMAALQPDELDRPTPCSEYTVRGVLEHMIGGATVFSAGFRGTEPGTPDTGDVLAAIGPALTDLLGAISAPGALDRTIQAPFGEVPGEAFAGFVVLDGLVHGWDLSTATGRTYAPSAELVAAVQSFAEGALPPLRDGVTFAAPTDAPSSATPIERLAAFTGRSVDAHAGGMIRS